MANLKIAPDKKTQIALANRKALIWACVGAFSVVFALVSAYNLVQTIAYQNKVVSLKKTALNQLESNLEARDSLTEAYRVFNSGEQNVIGGSVTGTGQRDGDNAKIMIDALPNIYDFPQLASSLEALANERDLEITSMGGTDDQVAQSAQTGSAQPSAVEMPFTITVEGAYDRVQSFVQALEKSIRPFNLQSVTYSASGGNEVSTVIAGTTYYQPTTKFQIEKRVEQ